MNDFSPRHNFKQNNIDSLTETSYWKLLIPTLFVGITISFSLFFIVIDVEIKKDEARFREIAEKNINDIKMNINIAFDSLLILAKHFEISHGNTSRSEFNMLSMPIIKWQIVATPGQNFKRSKLPISAAATLLSSLIATAFFAYGQRSSFLQMQRSALYAQEIAIAQKRLNEAHRIARIGFLEYIPVSGMFHLGDETPAMLGLSQ